MGCSRWGGAVAARLAPAAAVGWGAAGPCRGSGRYPAAAPGRGPRGAGLMDVMGCFDVAFSAAQPSRCTRELAVPAIEPLAEPGRDGVGSPTGCDCRAFCGGRGLVWWSCCWVFLLGLPVGDSLLVFPGADLPLGAFGLPRCRGQCCGLRAIAVGERTASRHHTASVCPEQG